MTSPIIYETFEHWFCSKNGYNKQAERFGGEHEWLKAAFEAGRAGAIESAAMLLEEGFDRVVADPYRDDGVPSKNDECDHGKFMYEDCEQCAVHAIRKLGEDK